MASATSSFANLDILRAFAVSTVFVGHCLHAAGTIPPQVSRLARFGVLAFFVHTSLVLMFSLERERLHCQPLKMVRSFYIRRAFRIYPLAIVCVLFCAVLHIPQVPWHASVAALDAENVVSNLLLVQNLVRGEVISAPLWSLPYEVQMYLLLPFLFLYIKRHGASGAWQLWLASLALGLVLGITRFISCFLAGVVAYSIHNRTRQIVPHTLWPAFILVVAIIYSVSDPSRWLDWVTCIIIGMAIPLFNESPASWFTMSSHTVAKYSYGIYLSHLPIITLILSSHWSPAIKIAAGALACMAIPPLLYHGLEAPLIQLGAQLACRGKHVTIGRCNLTHQRV